MNESWLNSTMDTLFYDQAADAGVPVEVRFEGTRIFVSYEDEEAGTVLYEGEDLGGGHYRLRRTQGHGDATLHRFDAGRTLEGYWSEGDLRGMWRIQLQR